MGGLAVGAVSIVSPLYIAEIAPPRSRGRFGALYQMSVVTGILLSYLTNYWLRDAGARNWRWMFLTGTVPAVIFLFLLLRAPETPRYLIMAGKDSQAQRTLARIVDAASVPLEFQRIQSVSPTARPAGRTCSARVSGVPSPSASFSPFWCMSPE